MPFSIVTRAFAVILGVAVVAGGTAARSDLRNEPVITEGLIAAAMAYEIGDKCPSLNARITQGIAFLWSLEAEARALGYSRDEINAYVRSDAEKDRMEALAWQRFAQLGGVREDIATYCAVGEAQMAQDTQVGRLLSR
ncbi:DUF5333 domain-containing protein [Wenxinia marina]|uniref:DUF5333 domain-containing protein n=1 Tax=Wenxinia marina DSM 24838 TaxID=1123501 RepID=A0A0D0QC44_9RHOB|nr:DUF5333 domain-containing protein [Wenxinia marina]KIQ69877.1 hypothetical protein Wenmar_01447 [Wenxinia marina DSM 24838]GGL61931.1 NADH dehydrogenase subunit E [Wenxinia marina]